MAFARRRQQDTPLVPEFDDGHKDYTYTPLEKTQIRLLRLLRGAPRTELEASLEVVNLPKLKTETTPLPPPYEAVSYHWGDKAKNPFDYSIKILKDSYSYRIFIRPNLEAALRQLRYRNKDRLLWVDALCINQKDEGLGNGLEEEFPDS